MANAVCIWKSIARLHCIGRLVPISSPIRHSARCSNFTEMKAQLNTKDIPQQKYNYGLSGKGKSKRLKHGNLPEVKGEVLFGLHPVHLAITTKKRSTFYAIYVAKKFLDSGDVDNTLIRQILDTARENSIPVHPTSKAVLDQLAGNRPHQGICLDAGPLDIPYWTTETEVSRYQNRLPLWLFLHHVQDPMNMGALLRTSQFFGVDKVIFSSHGSCSLSPVVSKASSGAMETVDLIKLPSGMPEEALCEWWQSRGWEVLGTTLDGVAWDGSKPYSLHKYIPSRPILLIMGNEGVGLNPDIMRACDTLVKIPSLEPIKSLVAVGSLNVSVAAGILLHWIRTSREHSQ